MSHTCSAHAHPNTRPPVNTGLAPAIAPETQLGSPRSPDHPHALPTRSQSTRVSHAVLKPTCCCDLTPPLAPKHAPTTSGPRAHSRVHSRHKHARTHRRACKDNPNGLASYAFQNHACLHLAPLTLSFFTPARTLASTRVVPTPPPASQPPPSPLCQAHTHWDVGAQSPSVRPASRRPCPDLRPARPRPSRSTPQAAAGTPRWAPGTAVSPPQPECARTANGGARR